MKHLAPALILLATLATPTRAHAFGTMTHSGITEEVMLSEGFNRAAVGAVKAFNFYVDLYEQSGHNWFLRTAAFVASLSPEAIDVADGMHFDGSSHLETAGDLEAEWQRLIRSSATMLQSCIAADDQVCALAVIGVSLHAVQDFYSHSNWVEPRAALDEGLADGPGWRERGLWGTHPTWFDIPRAIRAGEDIYGPGGSHRGHGPVFTEGNAGLINHMHKDMSARPYYTDAYVTAHIATRQWLRAMAMWSGDAAGWERVRRWQPDPQGPFAEGKEYGLLVGLATTTEGWDGCTKQASDTAFYGDQYYLERRWESEAMRALFERVLIDMQAAGPSAVPTPVPSIDASVASAEFVKARILHYRDVDGAADPFGDGEFYAVFRTGGRSMKSNMVRGEGDFYFTAECAPFTFITESPRADDRIEFELELWDADIPTSLDDQMDLAPDFWFLEDERTLSLFFDKRSLGLGGDTAGAGGNLQVMGGGSSRPAQIFASFETIVPRAPGYTFASVITVIL